MPAEDVLSLLGHSVNYRNVLGGEEIDREKAQAKGLQDGIENYYRELEARIKASKERRESSKLNQKIQSIDGKEYLIWTDDEGNIVKREELGKTTYKDQSKRLLKLPDGTLDFFGPGDKIPKGATSVEGAEGLTANQEFLQHGKFADIDAMMTNMVDEKGNDVDKPEALAGYAMQYNLNHPTHQWVQIPGHDSKWNEMGLDEDARWVKLPKDPQAMLAMPDETELSRDSKTGEVITLKMVKDKAQAAGATPEAVLQFLGLIK